MGMLRYQDIGYGVACGMVAASFAIEQVGMPTLNYCDNGVETWNNEEIDTRLDKYLKRTLPCYNL